MKFFYMDNCGLMLTSIIAEVKDTICKLVKHLEATSGIKVQKVCLYLEFYLHYIRFTLFFHLLLDRLNYYDKIYYFFVCVNIV